MVTPTMIRLCAVTCGMTMPIPSKASIEGFGNTLGGIFFPKLCDSKVVQPCIELFKSGEKAMHLCNLVHEFDYFCFCFQLFTYICYGFD